MQLFALWSGAGACANCWQPLAVRRLDNFLSSALLAYENVITLEDEVELIWGRKKTFASWLFLANRAILAAFVLDELIEYVDPAVRRRHANFFALFCSIG